jgi:hypothetical protein
MVSGRRPTRRVGRTYTVVVGANGRTTTGKRRCYNKCTPAGVRPYFHRCPEVAVPIPLATSGYPLATLRVAHGAASGREDVEGHQP